MKIERGVQESLLTLCRRSIVEYLDRNKFIDTHQDTEVQKLINDSSFLNEIGGCFVTLKKRDGELRGCIGIIEAEERLIDNIVHYAVYAATRDPRFPPIESPSELKELKVEISIMGQVTPLSTSPIEKRADDLEKIEIGTHGLIAESGMRRGLLLPQVAVEWNMDRKTFLEHTCQKAGLNKDAYKREDCKLYYFSATVFGESTC
jgi:AmmeMemoRadiSam system protein A